MTVDPTRSQRRFVGMPDGMYKNKTRRKARYCLIRGGCDDPIRASTTAALKCVRV